MLKSCMGMSGFSAGDRGIGVGFFPTLIGCQAHKSLFGNSLVIP